MPCVSLIRISPPRLARDRMSAPMTLILAGGGTGGHLTPGLAVATELRQREPDARIVFVGSDRPIDQRLLAGHERRVMTLLPLRSAWRSPARFAWAWWQAHRQARALLAEVRPHVVCGLGGLASIPLVRAAHQAGVPTLLLEQNVIPGRANRWMARSAHRVCVSFRETIDLLPHPDRCRLTGNPVRPPFASLASAELRPVTNLSTVLILGGSQGAQPLNDALLAQLPQSPAVWKDFHWVHQTGETGTDELRTAYQRAGLSCEVAPFYPDLERRIPQAAVVVSRAGATTLAELACAGVATVLVPYPQAADDHQRANARAYSAHRGAVVVEQEGAEPFPLRLANTLTRLLAEPVARQELAGHLRSLAHPDAAARVVDEICRAAGRG